MNKRNVLAAFGFSLGLWTACEIDSGEYRFGEIILGIEFQLYSDNIGVHPNKDVLLDPNNPFRLSDVGADTKWDIQNDGGNAAAFYSWATRLANEPTGEHQFYAASRLRDIYSTGEGKPEQREEVRKVAIRGFQAMLDYFPNAVTYDVTGTIRYRLALQAIEAIRALGGTVEGNWILVTSADGIPDAVPGPRTETVPQRKVADDE